MIRLGIVDFDSSHSIEFTRRFNHVGVENPQCVEGARVVLGSPGTSPMAAERISGFTADIEECHVGLVDDPRQMLGHIDAVLVLSLCGRVHRERVTPFLEAGVPAFVDKPFACSLSDAEGIIQSARENNTAVWSASALRFAEELRDFERRRADYGRVHGVVAYGPAKRDEGNPGLFHYGIHTVELLYTLMGPGCLEVTTTYEHGAEVVTGRWNDGRLATVRGNRAGATAYGVLAFCENGVVAQPVSTRYAYRNLCRAIIESFAEPARAGANSAVSNEVTLEIVRFILASLESERRGGAVIRLDSIP